MNKFLQNIPNKTYTIALIAIIVGMIGFFDESRIQFVFDNWEQIMMILTGLGLLGLRNAQSRMENKNG